MAGLGLVLTPQVWAIGTHAEAHSLHLALVAILLRLLVGWEDRRRAPTDDPRRDRADRWLVAATVVFGLAVGNHSLTLLLAPAVAAYVIAVEPGIVRRGRLVATCLAALAVTLVVVYLELPLRAGPFRAPLVYGQPDTWDGFRYIVLAEQFRGSVETRSATLISSWRISSTEPPGSSASSPCSSRSGSSSPRSGVRATRCSPASRSG